MLGSGLVCCGDVAAASDAALEAIAIWARREPDHVDVALAIELRAYIAATQGDGVCAARLAAYADASFTRLGYTRGYVTQAIRDRLTPLLHGLLGPADLAFLTAEGAALSPDAAIALAREHSRGHRRNAAVSAHNLAEVEFRREQYQRDAEFWREAVAVTRGENDPTV